MKSNRPEEGKDDRYRKTKKNIDVIKMKTIDSSNNMTKRNLR